MSRQSVDENQATGITPIKTKIKTYYSIYFQTCLLFFHWEIVWIEIHCFESTNRYYTYGKYLVAKNMLFSTLNAFAFAGQQASNSFCKSPCHLHFCKYQKHSIFDDSLLARSSRVLIFLAWLMSLIPGICFSFSWQRFEQLVAMGWINSLVIILHHFSLFEAKLLDVKL